MPITIKHRYTGAALYTSNTAVDLAGAVAEAVKARANLARADLAGAKGVALIIARTRILPDGDLVGWKKLRDGAICKLRIPANSKRSHAFGRKCRAEFVEVLEGEGVSSHDGVTKYAPGTRVFADKFDADWTHECAGGIHFFITREEAEAY